MDDHLYVFLFIFVAKFVLDEFFKNSASALDVTLVDQSSTLQRGASLKIGYQSARKLLLFILTALQQEMAKLVSIVKPVLGLVRIVTAVCHVQSGYHLHGLVNSYSVFRAQELHVWVALAEVSEIADQM